jgi:abortive infection bacteriophage resistance protein
VKYHKPSLSTSDLADLLLQRGLDADRNTLMERLEAVSYYRLSAYWFTFRCSGASEESLIPGTTLTEVWTRYTFDRQLRLLVMDAIERIEVAIRSQLVRHHASHTGPFGYLDRANLPGMSASRHREFLGKIRKEASRSREDFVQHYFDKYSSEHDLPIWMACELMTFGHMLTLFRHTETATKQSIAASYGVADKVLESWLLTLNYIRNLCAHHARLWNRGLGTKNPTIPRARKHPDWHAPVPIESDRLFGTLTIPQYMLTHVAPQSAWKERLLCLFDQYPSVPRRFMGFPDNWQESPLWQ